MKSASEIISAIGLIKNQFVMEHAGKLAAIYKLLESEKMNILSVATEPTKVKFGRKVERKYGFNNSEQETIKNEGEELEAETFKVTTHRGEYTVAVPTNNAFHTAMRKLLDLPTEQPKQDNIIRSFRMPAGVLDAISRAKEFVGNDDLRPVMQTVLVEISDNKAVVVATNAHYMFLSEKFDVVGPGGMYQYMLPATSLKKLPKATEDFTFGEFENNKVCFHGHSVELFTDGNFPQYQVIIPEYETEFAVVRKDLVANIKQVLPSANKATNLVAIVVTDQIKLRACDLDLDKESSAAMTYAYKTVPDFFIGMNGKFTLTALNAFKSDQIIIKTDGRKDKCLIFTDRKDMVVIMPLLLHGEIEDQVIGDRPTISEPEEITEAEVINEQEEQEPEVMEVEEIEELECEPVVTRERIRTGQSPIYKAANIYARYLDWLFESGAKVFIHLYDEHINIRYIKGQGRSMIRGSRKLLRPANDQFLIEALECKAESYGEKIINKTSIHSNLVAA